MCLMCLCELTFHIYTLLAHLGESRTACRISGATGIFRVCLKRQIGAGAVVEEPICYSVCLQRCDYIQHASFC